MALTASKIKSMSNASDVARIGYVLANYDSVELALKEDGTPDAVDGYLDAQMRPAKKLVYSNSNKRHDVRNRNRRR